MEKVNSTSQFDIQVILKLSEKEARALHGITSYGSKQFLKCFYEHLGKAYLEEYESGIESLFETIKQELPQHLSRADDVRSVWKGDKVAVRKS